MKKIYISGPITGMPDANRAAFEAAARDLRAAGYFPVSPLDNGLSADATWEQHMRADIPMMLQCDGVAWLAGWSQSEGCKLEVNIANRLGFQIEPVHVWVNARWKFA